MTSYVLEARSLRKSFGSHVVVDGIDFGIEPGEVFGLLGPNGAGKTTTMLMLTGLLEPDAGSVYIDGLPFSAKQPESRRWIGVAPQDVAVYPELSARENLKFFGRLYGLTGSLLNERIEEVLELVGLHQTEARESGLFSGGMKRRLNFAVAILHHPKVLILDEPTVGVDPQSRAHMLDLVQLLGRQGVAILYCSHYMDEVSALCSRVAIMDHGKLLACDLLPALLQRMRHEVHLHLAVTSTPKIDVAPFGAGAKLLTLESGEFVLSLPNDNDNRDSEMRGNESRDAATVSGRLSNALSRLLALGIDVRAVQTTEPSLERLFLELTGRTLRD